MAKQFFEHTRLAQIRAGDIGRHPEHQRPSPVKKFERKYGKFEYGRCAELIHVVESHEPNGPKWLAVNGATRVESCIENDRYGPNTKLTCKVYGNGEQPSGKELDELFLLLNTDHVKVGGEIEFRRSVGAERRSAVFAAKLLEKMGPHFKSQTGLWKLVEKHGEAVSESAVTFAINTWGTDKYMPGLVIKALAVVFENQKDTATLRKRRNALSKVTPELIRLRAQQKHYTQVGRRDDITSWAVRVLLGRRSDAD